MAMTVSAVMATDYDVPIIVTVNGVSSEQNATITVNNNDGLYDLTLRNFMLQSDGNSLGVGNVALTGIKPYVDGDATLLIAAKQVTITDGDDASVDFWMASILPPVDVLLRGKIEGDELRCYLDIDLAALQQVVQVVIGGGYQMPNPSFEEWHTAPGNYEEPNGWHSFESATGSLVSLAGHHLNKTSDAHSGDASARLYATSIFGIVANGTMTTGRMNAGSMTAANTVNNAYLDMSDTEVDGNGDPFYTPFSWYPDEVAVWVKFKQGRANNQHPYATISAVITDGTYYQDPEDKTYWNVVAKAKNNKIANTSGRWVRVTAPFTYTSNDVEPKAVLITLSTNANAGQGSNNDELLVDDIEFIYNATVTGLKIKGQNVKGFSTKKKSYEMELNEVITADDIEVTVDGRSAYVAKDVETDGDHFVCTVHALSADMSAMSTYVVNVKSNATDIRNLPTATNHESAVYFTLDGRQATTLVPGNIYICRQGDGTVKKIRL